MADDVDPRAYLETEARIIAENDTYAVIAVRVEKSLISRNLPLLAVLSDLVPLIRKAKCSKAAGAG